MDNPNQEYSIGNEIPLTNKKYKQKYWLHILLFVITFITTAIAGAEWITGFGHSFDIKELLIGLPYSVSILFMLGSHEFGHFFASKYHKVDATLPYFIPFPSLEGFLNFGTLGAVIRTRSPIPSKKALFDIGVAGPLAGFVACIIILIYGFTHLPGIDYIIAIHPDYFSPEYGKNALNLQFGNTLLYYFMQEIFTDGSQFIPPMSEIYHYPYLCVGWFGLFVTAMNLIPVGQLDGGHIAYAVFGEKKHLAIASISMIMLIILGVGGFVTSFINMNFEFGWSGWLFWAFILYFFIKIQHPPIYDDEELDPKRKIIGYISLLIFVISFSPNPFLISVNM
ncbi:MAG: site-2 protease family protein [Ignavibacterium sp.]